MGEMPIPSLLPETIRAVKTKHICVDACSALQDRWVLPRGYVNPGLGEICLLLLVYITTCYPRKAVTTSSPPSHGRPAYSPNPHTSYIHTRTVIPERSRDRFSYPKHHEHLFCIRACHSCIAMGMARCSPSTADQTYSYLRRTTEIASRKYPGLPAADMNLPVFIQMIWLAAFEEEYVGCAIR